LIASWDITTDTVFQALGCVVALPGYLQAMKDVCHRHGALRKINGSKVLR
jgi:glutamate-1-semialdehyde aminotransferase